jgi:DNA-binding LytR/AlgR family response regulator
MKLKCMIVDDEPLAIEVIESYLLKLDDIEIVAKCEDALQAFEMLRKETIDIIFLDIQMPKLTGLEFIKILDKKPKVILTTAYRNYALDGFDLDVTDYLLKPISFERFLKAMAKVYKNDTPPTPIQNHLKEDMQPTYLFFKQDKKMVKVDLNDILYIESLKDYVKIITSKKVVITHENIGKLITDLPDWFVRVHKSYIISLSKVECYSPNFVELAENKEIPIGKSFKEEALEKLNAYTLKGI